MEEKGKIVPFTLEQVKVVYDTWLVRDFPGEEVKPFKNIQSMWHSGNYYALGLYSDANELLGYALFVKVEEVPMLLLDYFAVLEPYRKQGIGSYFLQQLREQAGEQIAGIFIETEDVSFAETQQELLERTRRDCFYEKNGAEYTGMTSAVYDARYRIYVLPCKTDQTSEMYLSFIQKIYQFMLSGEKYEKYVFFFCSSECL